MAARMGGQQISALLESLPGIASVLRSPVADAIVYMIRAGAGLGEYRDADAQELVQYAVRRGLIGSDEGEELLAEVKGAGRRLKRAASSAKKATKPAAKKKATHRAASATKRTTKAARPAVKTAKKKTVKKSTAKKAVKKKVVKKRKR